MRGSRYSHYLLLLGSAILSLLLLELTSFLIYEPNSVLEMHEDLLEKEEDLTEYEEDFSARTVLHPYLGYVHNPVSFPRSYNRLGFYGTEPIFSRSDEDLIVGVTGGSVSVQFCIQAGEELKQELASFFAEKNIEIRCIGLGGYRQPQQLLGLAYFLAMGADFDLIINLDGFNDVRISSFQNFRMGIHYTYPWNWKILSNKSFNKEETLMIYEIEKLTDQRNRIRRFFSTGILSRTYFGKLLFAILNNNKVNQIRMRTIELNETVSELDYQTTGPFEKGEPRSAVLARAIDLWAESSVQMGNLSEANDISYFHFLQPNSCCSNKALTDEEQFRRGPGELEFLQEAYEKLRDRGEELVGINYFDIADVLDNETDTLYKDPTHFNTRGYELLAKQIAQFVTSNYE